MFSEKRKTDIIICPVGSAMLCLDKRGELICSVIKKIEMSFPNAEQYLALPLFYSVNEQKQQYSIVVVE